MFFPNRVQFLSTYRHQRLALPDPIMEYIAKNPQFVEVYQKLIESCKYFFIKNPILVIRDLSYYSRNGWEMGSLISDNWKKIDMNKLSCKLWIIGYLEVITTTSDDKNVLSLMITKIYKCQVKLLKLFGQNVFYEELDILEDFDIESFFVFIKTNKHTEIQLKFAETISEAYKARLNAVIDEIFKTEEHDYKLLWIDYPGIMVMA